MVSMGSAASDCTLASQIGGGCEGRQVGGRSRKERKVDFLWEHIKNRFSRCARNSTSGRPLGALAVVATRLIDRLGTDTVRTFTSTVSSETG